MDTKTVSTISSAVTPLARIFEHENDYWTTIATAEQRHGHICFHNAAYSKRYHANHAGNFRGDDGDGPRIAAEVIQFYRSRNCPPVAYLDALTTPTDLDVHLQAAGFVPKPQWSLSLMFYLGPDLGEPTTVATHFVASAKDRLAWASMIEEGTPDQRSMLQDMYFRQLGDPRVRGYYACLDGVTAARSLMFSSDGIGRLAAMRTSVAYRNRGLASALARRRIQDSLDLGHRLTMDVDTNGIDQHGAKAKTDEESLGGGAIIAVDVRQPAWVAYVLYTRSANRNSTRLKNR